MDVVCVHNGEQQCPMKGFGQVEAKDQGGGGGVL